MSQLLLEKVETMLYNACDQAPFYIQIDKYTNFIGLLSFVDKETNLIGPIPENIEVYTMKLKENPLKQNHLIKEYELENKIEHVANKPCFKITTQKHYVVLWEKNKIMELKPLAGWSMS